MNEFETRAIGALERIAQAMEEEAKLMHQILDLQSNMLTVSKENQVISLESHDAYIGWIKWQKEQQSAVETLGIIQKLFR